MALPDINVDGTKLMEVARTQAVSLLTSEREKRSELIETMSS
jgi:hypothetical protein